MLLSERVGGASLRFDIRIDFGLVSVVIRKRRMHLRQRKMVNCSHDFLGNQAHIVPLGDAPHRHTSARNARPASA